MTAIFQKATKTRSRLRMAIDGPSGSGKTFTGLICATALGERIAVIDTERGSASKYADMFDFDVLELETFSPQDYIEGITAAEQAGYDVLLIDSLSHAWEGKGGVLEMHDNATRKSKSGNSWTAWRDVTPEHRSLIDAMLQSKCHIIATMRSKMDYIQTADDKGRTTIRKVGMAPVQRQGMEYEFDIVGEMDVDHNFVISKSRCFDVADAVENRPDVKWFGAIKRWLEDGAAPKEEPKGAPWTRDKTRLGKFWAWTRDTKGLTHDQVHEALEVESVSDYTGTPQQAMDKIEAWLDEQMTDADRRDEQEANPTAEEDARALL